MYLTAWGNQFEITDTCIEFVINNVSPQGNVKIKLNFKVEEICRVTRPNFLWNQWQRTRILFSLIRGILTTVWKTWYEVLCKNSKRLNTVNNFCRKLHLRYFTGFWIVSDYLEAFSIVINWGFEFEYFMNGSSLISILMKYL